MPGRLKRILKHLWFDEAQARRAVSPAMAQRLKQRVAASEQHHSGQIRICVEASLPAHALWRNASTLDLTHARAVALFSELRVWDTEANNGVLIYLLLAERAIELVADRGLNRRVPAATWQAMTRRMAQAFRERRFEDGLTQALEEVSALLVQYFPLAPGQPRHNELPDAPAVR